MQNRPHFRFFKRQCQCAKVTVQRSPRMGFTRSHVCGGLKIWMRQLLIREYGTQHSESILTENQRLATQFINQVDAAAVCECKLLDLPMADNLV